MADTKIKHWNKACLVDVSAIANNNAVESAGMAFRTEQIGATFYTLSDQAGSMQIQVYMANPDISPETMLDADWKNMGAARVITANTLDVFTLQQGMMPVRVIFTPSANPHTTRVFCWGFGG